MENPSIAIRINSVFGYNRSFATIYFPTDYCIPYYIGSKLGSVLMGLGIQAYACNI